MIFCDINDYEIFHYRDHNGLEVDCLIKNEKGEYGAIEIKLGPNEIESAKVNLNKFSKIVKEN
jgi:predicted AAA+ superfamily ATPase